jgi:dimethylargininase
MYTKCIVREPCPEMVDGLTSSDLGKPDYSLAVEQHKAYVAALEKCGCQVYILPADARFPDSVFVEDAALLIGDAAIITLPGAESRRNEIVEMRTVLMDHFDSIEEIISPGTLEAGDIMEVGDHYYIGVSERTNQEGAEQLIQILKKYGKTVSTIPLLHYLHLKTGVAFAGENTLLVAGELIEANDFQKFKRIVVDEDEEYAANSVLINGKVLMPFGYPKTREALMSTGSEIIEVDTSEFRKLDGGISCLSLRF